MVHMLFLAGYLTNCRIDGPIQAVLHRGLLLAEALISRVPLLRFGSRSACSSLIGKATLKVDTGGGTTQRVLSLSVRDLNAPIWHRS